MSLLMDALRKAEEAKRQSEASAKSEPQERPSSGDQAAPAAAAPAAEPRGLPELPSRLELLDAEFHTAASQGKAEPASTRPAPKQEAEAAQKREQAAAKNLFQAKQPAQRKPFLIIVGLATLLAAAGIGGYFWWQLQPTSGLVPGPGAARPAMPAPAAPPTPIAAVPSVPPAATASTAPTQDTGAAPPTPPPAPPAAAAPAPSAARPAAAEPAPIRVTTARLKLNPLIASAYQAFQAGDAATAQRDYQQVLKSEPKNTDALHGLAAISLQQGQFEAAENLYLRILEADPKDNAAQAGLIGMRGQVDPIQSESRLKNLLASQPDSPFLNFTLGNLYARQGRWSEAQQAYFRAYSVDGENPDYQFNLAVSLEQLRQPRLALQYYQGALAAAAQRPAGFDRNQAAGRIRELQQ